MKITQIRQKGNQLYLRGQIEQALSVYKKMLNLPYYKRKVPMKDRVNDLKGVCNMLFYLSRFEEALHYAKEALKPDPNDLDVLTMVAIYTLKCKQFEESITIANKVLAQDSRRVSIYDLLAEAHGLLKQADLCQQAGYQALTLKDEKAMAESGEPITLPAIKPFDPQTSQRNIISYSLFGDSSKYCEAAVVNAKRAAELYPGWRCRFYCASSVPSETVRNIAATGAEIVSCEQPKDVKEALFWRFRPLGDPDVDWCIVRDCDSILSVRESVAVKAWLESGKHFHIMRDFATHTDLILAGMFGSRGGIFPDIEGSIERFLKEVHTGRTHLDQRFLSLHVWPYIKNSQLTHDSYFRFMGVDFPPHPALTDHSKDFHVGCNEATLTLNVKFQSSDVRRVAWTIQSADETVCRYEQNVTQQSMNAVLPLQYRRQIESGEYRFEYQVLEP